MLRLRGRAHDVAAKCGEIAVNALLANWVAVFEGEAGVLLLASRGMCDLSDGLILPWGNCVRISIALMACLLALVPASGAAADNVYCVALEGLVRRSSEVGCAKAFGAVAASDEVAEHFCAYFVWDRVDYCEWKPQTRELLASLGGSKGVLGARLAISVREDGKIVSSSCLSIGSTVGMLRKGPETGETRGKVQQVLGVPGVKKSNVWLYVEPCEQAGLGLGKTYSLHFVGERLERVLVLEDVLSP